ncbi:MAG TPA: copper chaperone PCu(A)C [Candidatus Limnocylindrales bacterium]|nr:copper chaperone PCu(A)C [Candidatus Limnocylindrales bacterium]
MRRLAALLLLSLVLVVAACSPGGGSTASGGGIVTVSGAWARAAAKGAMTAAYLQVVNGRLSDDVLVGVSTDAAQTASLHQTTTDSDGMTGMQPVDGITVPAGKTVMLEPGGYHIMLEGLTADLAAGSQVRLVLTFEQGGPLNVTAEVRAN